MTLDWLVLILIAALLLLFWWMDALLAWLGTSTITFKTVAVFELDTTAIIFRLASVNQDFVPEHRASVWSWVQPLASASLV